LCFFFCCVQFSLAQIQSGEVIYKVRPPESVVEFIDTTKKDPDFKKWILKEYHKIKQAAPYLTYTLKFNKKEALFDRPETMANENGMDLNHVAQATGAIGIYYNNASSQQRIHQQEFHEKYWRIQSGKVNWKIQKETKDIQGYTCRKATAEVTYFNHIRSKKKRKAVAWFCPELPFQFGPKGYGGLPVLILELDVNQYTFYADKIELQESDRPIKKPAKGKLISTRDFSKKVMSSGPPRP